MLSHASLMRKDKVELVFLIYSLFSGNAGVSGWKIGSFLFGLDKLEFLNSSAVTEENHDESRPSRDSKHRFVKSKPKLSSAAWDNLIGSSTADGEPK
jgi:hypothetical protein